jgi:integrase
MKHRFWLFKRKDVFYIEDTQTGEQKSLGTRDRKEAERLRATKDDAASRPFVGLAIGKAYLAAHDPQLVERTWSVVMEEFKKRGKEHTHQRRERAMQSKPFRVIRNRKLVETTADNLHEVIALGGSSTNHFLRCLHNLALGVGWLPGPIIPPKLWPVAKSKPKRGITQLEHERIIAAERNKERRHYYEILWEIGAAQTDGALLSADNIDWQKRVLQYQRKKTGEWACIQIGARLEALLRDLPSSGPLFPHIGQTTDSARAAEFSRRCRTVGLTGVSLHSYRYAWAERAKAAGYPERHAQNALGHNSSAVHAAYAKGIVAVCPALEEYERQPSSNVVSLPAQRPSVEFEQ